MKKVLLITYVFPPVGGAGVQRTLKWTRYLPEFGWKPYVLTAKNPSVPLFDESLALEIPKEMSVVRTRTLEPPYRLKRTAWNGTKRKPSLLKVLAKNVAQRVFFPDPQIGWLPTAYRAALQLIRNEGIDAILTSAPPFSTHLLGRKIARKTGVPWLADFRDEWVDFYTRAYDFHRRAGAAAKVAAMEALVCKEASALLTVTNGILSNYRRKYPGLGEPNSFWIPNGFDERDFEGPTPEAPPDAPFTLAYSGTVFEVTSARFFLAGLSQLLERRPDVRTKLKVLFQGRIDPREEEPFDRPELAGLVDRIGYRPHSDALRAIRGADALLLLLSDLPGAERILTGKIFEYLAAGKPILAVVPEGEIADLVRSTGAGVVVSPSDVEGIGTAVLELLEGKQLFHADPSVVARFSRRETTRELARVLDRLGGTQR